MTYSARWLGFTLNCYPDDGVVLDLQQPDFNQHLLRALDLLLKEGDAFVDVGSHIGSLSLYASRLVGPGGRVCAFELNPAIYRDCLVPNILDNKCLNIVPYNLGVGATRHQVGYSAPCPYGGAYQNRGMISVVETTPHSDSVLCVPLDELLVGPVAVLKIDVEGYEGHVLQGARKLIEDQKPVLLVEIDVHGARFDCPPAKLLALLDALGYKVFLLNSPYPTDFVCVHQDRLQEYPQLFERVYPFTVSLDFALAYPELAAGDQYKLVERVLLL